MGIVNNNELEQPLIQEVEAPELPEAPPTKAAQAISALNGIGTGADKSKEFLINLNSLFASLLEMQNGDISKIREAIENKVQECIDQEGEAVRETLEAAVKEKFDHFLQPISKILETITEDNEVEYRGITINLGKSLSSGVKEDVDEAAGIVFNQIKRVKELAKEEIQKNIEKLEMLASDTVRNLLGGDVSSEENIANELIGYQIIDFLGDSADVARATAEAVGLLEGIRKGDKKLTAEASLELDTIFSAHSSTLIEGKSFVDGIRLAIDAGFLTSGSAELTGTAKAQLSDDVYAQISGQANAYFKVAGDFSSVAKFGLFDGLELTAGVSFEAQVSVSASLTADIRFGELLMIKADASGSARAGANARASGRLVIKNGEINLEGKANFRLGAEVTATAGFSVNEGFSLSVKASAIAGLAAEVGGSFSIEGGKLHLSIDIGAALGPGGALGLDLEIDFEKMLRAIAKEIEACLLTRWQNRRLDLGTPPPLMPDEELSLVKVLESRDVDGSAFFGDVLKAAVRPLPVGNDDEFLRQLELFCRGFWKEYLKQHVKETKARNKRERIVVDDAIVEAGASTAAESSWHSFNQLLADVVNIKYGKVIIVTYNKNGSLLSTLTDLTIGDKPGSQKGNFIITRISADVDSLINEFTSADEVGKTDFNLLAKMVKQEGLQINNVDSAQESIRNIAEKYWEEYFIKYPYDAKPKTSTGKEGFWESRGHGETQGREIAEFFGRLIGGYYTVQAPANGDESKCEFTVNEISVDRNEWASSYAEQIDGIFRKMFSDESEPLDVNSLAITECKRLQTTAIPILSRVLREVHNADGGSLMGIIDDIDEDILERIWVYLDEKNFELTIEQIAQELDDLASGPIQDQVERIEDARTAFGKLAKKISDDYENSRVLSEDGYKTRTDKHALDFNALQMTHDIALAVDDDMSAECAKAFVFVCNELLDRPKIGSDIDKAIKASEALLTDIKKEYDESNLVSEGSYTRSLANFEKKITERQGDLSKELVKYDNPVIKQNVKSCQRLLKLPQRDLDPEWLQGYEETLRRTKKLGKKDVANIELIKSVTKYTGIFYDEAEAGKYEPSLPRISVQRRASLGTQSKWDKEMSPVASKVWERDIVIENGQASFR